MIACPLSLSENLQILLSMTDITAIRIVIALGDVLIRIFFSLLID